MKFIHSKMMYTIPRLPLEKTIESPQVLKKAIKANKVLAELKGIAQTIPNQALLINTLSVQEAKDSSEVESIVTTHDELFRSDNFSDISSAAKEVHHYNEALFHGFNSLKKNKIIANKTLIEVVKILTERDAGFRNLPGTALKNPRTGKVVYTPPQDFSSISEHMKNLEQFINDAEISDLDPLVKMAVIHHQFESIHPFFDGNGRVGRILNILYLLSEDILDIPILYLSRYITQNKADYYNLLQKVRDEDTWEEWILFILEALEVTAKQTILTIKEIKRLMSEYKSILKADLPKIYSHELINNIFSHPYTKVEHLMKDAHISRITASKYLKSLVEIGLLDVQKHKNTNYYINRELLKLFTDL